MDGVKRFLLAALLALPAHAEHRLWKASLAALAGASAWDTQSSWGGSEANPVLGHGNFGARQAGVKIGLIGGVALVEWITVRKTHRDRVLTWTNFAAAGVTAGVAARNMRME